MLLIDAARSRLSLAFILLLGSSVRASADPFSYTTVDVGSQPYATVLTAINDTGLILGYSFGAKFLDTNGSISVLTIPVPYDFYATGINNAGQIVGTYFSHELGPNGFEVGFLYSNGVLTTINVPGSSLPPDSTQASTAANGINNLGQIVGGYSNRGTAGISLRQWSISSAELSNSRASGRSNQRFRCDRSG